MRYASWYSSTTNQPDLIEYMPFMNRVQEIRMQVGIIYPSSPGWTSLATVQDSNRLEGRGVSGHHLVYILDKLPLI